MKTPNNTVKGNAEIASTLILLFIGVGAIIVVLLLWPIYRTWAQEQRGKAQLREAEWTRKIKIEEAKAHSESALEFKKSEIIRAEGVAEANKIISDSLKGNEAYLRYLWIQTLSGESGNRVIYIPTEANLPILEADRLSH